MIAVLGELVRGIAVIIIITTFLELLMPGTGMRRYIQLVLGLFVIITLLNPVTTFLNSGVGTNINAPQISEEKEALHSILAAGEALSRQSNDTAAREYKNSIEKQMASLLRLIPGVEDVSVAVRLETGSPEAMPAHIQGVSLDVLASGDTSPREQTTTGPIEVDLEKKGEIRNILGHRNLEDKITDTLCDFYNLRPAMIDIRMINN